jgi:hypothetical protein
MRAAVHAIVILTVSSAPGLAQDPNAWIEQQMRRQAVLMQQGQAQINDIVQRRMADPRVKAAYQQHVAVARGRGLQPWNYETFTYNYIRTNGYSADDTRAAMEMDRRNATAQQQGWRGVQAAEAARAHAQQEQRNSYARSQYEAGLALQGRATYLAPDGRPFELPHGWQAGEVHEWNGNVYGVDAGRNYWIRGVDGRWYPLRSKQ